MDYIALNNEYKEKQFKINTLKLLDYQLDSLCRFNKEENKYLHSIIKEILGKENGEINERTC